MQSTLQIFKYLYQHLPPLCPKEVGERIKKSLERADINSEMNIEQLENEMIKIGYEIWPWNQAYKEFLMATEDRLGEHFLLPHLGDALKEKYAEFVHHGGDLRELHSGRPADFFTNEERLELCRNLVDMQVKLREYVDRDIVGLNKKKYLQRVEGFKKMLAEIKNNLENLRKLADGEEEHPSLAQEIAAKVREFEYGLCLLGPEINYEAVCKTEEFFRGRKTELNRFKGINIPMQIDWYNQ
jgi:hypothetical protein